MATARSSDGIVEAMELKPEESKRMPFLLACNFIPNGWRKNSRNTARFFREFVASLRPQSIEFMKSKILIVDDEADVRDLLVAVLDGTYTTSPKPTAARRCKNPLPSPRPT